jgi:hypothetical protein
VSTPTPTGTVRSMRAFVVEEAGRRGKTCVRRPPCNPLGHSMMTNRQCQ